MGDQLFHVGLKKGECCFAGAADGAALNMYSQPHVASNDADA
jgi:hypothetical protein